MLHNRAGQELPVEVSLAYVPRSSGHLFIAFLHDISERKSLFASMEAMALKDTLTGLPNRRALMQALPEALRRANRCARAAPYSSSTWTASSRSTTVTVTTKATNCCASSPNVSAAQCARPTL
jgi:hypothetical protein